MNMHFTWFNLSHTSTLLIDDSKLRYHFPSRLYAFKSIQFHTTTITHCYKLQSLILRRLPYSPKVHLLITTLDQYNLIYSNLYLKMYHAYLLSYWRTAKYIAWRTYILSVIFFYNNHTALTAQHFPIDSQLPLLLFFSRKSGTYKPTQQLDPLNANEYSTPNYKFFIQ